MRRGRWPEMYLVDTCSKLKVLMSFGVRVILPLRYADQLDFLSNVHMKWSILFFFLCKGFSVATAAEEYREELTLRPLVDGKLSAHFSFSTLLPDAVPRDPSSLGTDDACT